MGYCWKCLEDSLGKGKFCGSCGYKLEHDFNGYTFSLHIPEKGDPDSSFYKMINLATEPFFSLKKKLNEKASELEEGLETKVEMEIWPFTDLDYIFGRYMQYSNLRKKQYLEIMVFVFQLEELERQSSKSFVADLASDANIDQEIPHILAFLRISKTFEQNGLIERYFGKTSQGSFNAGKNSIELREIHNELIKESFSNAKHKDLTKPFFLKMAEEDKGRTEGHLSHELTHAYFTRELNIPFDKRPLNGMEEAACNVITCLHYDNFFDRYYDEEEDEWHFISFIVDSYRERRVPKSLLQICIRAFLDLAEDYEGTKKQKIDLIRKEGKNAIIRIQENKNMSPPQAILQNNELNREYKIYRDLEIAEYLSLHSMMLLGVIGPEELGKYKKWVHDAIEDGTPFDFDDRFALANDKDTNRLLERDISLMKNAENDLEQLIDNENKGENLEKLRHNLQKIIEIIEDEHRFLEHPFCEHCGSMLKPGSDKCSECGGFVKSNTRDFEAGIEFLMEETNKSSHAFKSGEKMRKNTLEEVIMNLGMLINHTEAMNYTVLRTLEKLHDVENRSGKYLDKLSKNSEIRKKYPDLFKLKEATEEAFEVSKRAENLLQRAKNAIEKAEEEFQKIDG